MKKAGFTLIELITVLVILGLIGVLAVPRVLDLLNDSKDESMKALAETFIGEAKFYVNTYESFNAPIFEGDCNLITLSALEIEATKTPYGDSIDLNNSYVLIDYNSNYYLTVVTSVGSSGIKNLYNSMLANDELTTVVYESSDTNHLEVPDVSALSEGSIMFLDVNGDGILGESTCTIYKIRN